MASVLTQSKIKVLKWLTKSKSMWPLTSLTFPLFLTHSTPAKLASLLTLTDQKLSCLRAWALLNSFTEHSSPVICMSFPHLLQACALLTNSQGSFPDTPFSNSTQTPLSILFLCFIFLHSTPCHQMTNYIIDLFIAYLLSTGTYAPWEQAFYPLLSP